jgi:hypothetical protein
VIGEHALRRVTRNRYLSNAKKITHVISAKPINNVLWPHRATIPIMFQSPEFTPTVNRRSSSAAHVLYGGGTVYFQVEIKHVVGLKNAYFRHITAEIALPDPLSRP